MKPLEALRALGTGGEAPPEAKQRVQAALTASLAAAAAAAAVSAAARSAGLASTPPATSPLILGLTSAKVLAVAGGIWLMGGATGAALYGALHTQEVRLVYLDRPVFSGSVTAPSMPPMVPASAAGTTMPTVADTGGRHALPASVTQGSELARERAVLDLARAAAAHGEPALVLEQTERHRAQFPRAKLGEEREALAIRALLSLGRADQARARATAFHLAYPHSLLTPAIDSALSAQ